jgi:two-component system cell cycle sensor histidine kinase/response regulator CckA
MSNELDQGEESVVPETAGLERRATVLVVDDEPFICRNVARILEPHGYAVLEATTYEAAIEHFARYGKKIDLVILDIVIPDGDGEEVFVEVRHWNPAVRVLVSSGYADHDSIKRIAMQPRTAILDKPYQPAELLLAVETLLENEGRRLHEGRAG